MSHKLLERIDKGNLHQVSPEELTLVYNLRKMMMNDWVSSRSAFGCVTLSN